MDGAAAPGALLGGGERVRRWGLGGGIAPLKLTGGESAAINDEGIDAARLLGERLAQHHRPSVIGRTGAVAKAIAPRARAERSIAFLLLSCDSRLVSVISFTPQLFFAVRLCFDVDARGGNGGACRVTS